MGNVFEAIYTKYYVLQFWMTMPYLLLFQRDHFTRPSQQACNKYWIILLVKKILWITATLIPLNLVEDIGVFYAKGINLKTHQHGKPQHQPKCCRPVLPVQDASPHSKGTILTVSNLGSIQTFFTYEIMSHNFLPPPPLCLWDELTFFCTNEMNTIT